MHIHTLDEGYEYRLKKILKEFVSKNRELQDLDTEKLQDALWSEDYVIDFGRAILEDMQTYAGDELFEIAPKEM